jgi:hypothetical protein
VVLCAVDVDVDVDCDDVGCTGYVGYVCLFIYFGNPTIFVMMFVLRMWVLLVFCWCF